MLDGAQEKFWKAATSEIHIKEEFPLDRNAVFSRKELPELTNSKTCNCQPGADPT